jgi:dolichol-phosphate mannosyltransferase
MQVLVVLPTFNERPNLERIVGAILAHAFTQVLIVDDDSPDGTGQLAEQLARSSPGRVHVLHRAGRRGLGLAYTDGLRRAIELAPDAIGQMDADFSHDPAYLPAMVARLATTDLVIGSRYLKGVSVVNWPLHRLFLSAFANGYIRWVTGLPTRDCTSGYRLWRREAVSALVAEQPKASGYAFLTEMLFRAGLARLRIAEVPIIFVEREEGYSKVSKKVLIESLLTPLRLMLRHGRLRHSKTSPAPAGNPSLDRRQR